MSPVLVERRFLFAWTGYEYEVAHRVGLECKCHPRQWRPYTILTFYFDDNIVVFKMYAEME